MKHLRWGLIGAGNIAVKFARGLNSTEEATALAIGSRRLDKAQQFAEAQKIERAYGSYDEVLADSEVDAVYLALPNHLHAEWSIKSAQAGKHILCEKPVTMNAAELEQVLEVVKAQDVFFMEAFMYRCHPQWQKVREILAAGSIGEVRVLHSAFAFDMGENFENTRMSNPMGGGGLLDVGSYCVSFARLIAGEEPEEVRAVGHLGDRSRVDEWMTGLLKFPSGLAAYFTSGIRCDVPPAADIYGSEGSLRITAPWQPAEENAFVILNAGGKTEEFQIKSGLDLYANEALHVAKHLNDRQAPAMNWEDSLGQVRTIDALRADMGLVWDQEKGA